MRAAAYCGTEAIYEDIEASSKSLYANSLVDEIHWLVEIDHWPHELPDFIKIHNVKDQQYFDPDGPNMRSGFTYMAMMRAALCYELPEYDRILSLDADLIVEKDCTNIWDIDIEDCYLSASVELQFCRKGLRYVNVGVTLYNLEKLRDGKADEVIHLLNVQKLPNLEQDAFSYLCQGHINEMNPVYNRTNYTGGYVDPIIIRHFAGYKRDEWIRGIFAAPWRNADWKVAIDLHNSLRAAHRLP